MENIKSLTELLSDCLNCLYFNFYEVTKDSNTTNEMLAQFLINKTSYDDIFKSRNLQGNPAIYKKMSILYLSLRVYMSEFYNKENGLSLRTTNDVLEKLDDVYSPSDLLSNFTNIEKYRTAIVCEGIRLISDKSEVRSYKQVANLKTNNKIMKMLHLFPQIMLELPDQQAADKKDILINDIVEIYQFELSKILDEIYEIKNKIMNQVLSDVEEGMEEEEIDQNIQEMFADNLNKYSDDVEIMKKLFIFTWKKIKEKYKDKKDLYTLVGVMIGNVYTNLSINAENLSPFDKKIKCIFELPSDNADMFIEAVLNDKELGYAVLDLLLEYNTIDTTKAERIQKEKKLSEENIKYVKIMKKYDTFYKDK